MEKDNKIPAIRFKDFDGPWEQRKLSEFADKAVDNRGKTPPLDTEGVHPLIEVAALGYGAPNYLKVEKYLNDYAFKNYLRGYIKQGDILFSTVGSIGLVSIMDKRLEACIAQNIVAFRANEKYDAKYLYAMFSNEGNQKKAQRIVMGAVQPSIKVSQLVDVEYTVSNNLDEQMKIGTFFSNLDNLITLHQHKLEKLKIIKNSMLENFFPEGGKNTPNIRFKAFNDTWEQRKLSEVSEKVIEKNKDNLFSETLTNSAEHGIINQRDFFDKDISNEKNLDGYYVVRENDFVYNPRISNFAPVGPIKRNKLGRTGVMSPLYYVFRTKEIDNSYLEYFFENITWHKFMILNGDSGARSDRFAIKDSVFKEMPIPYPHLLEQEKIGAFFFSFDNLITLHQCKVKKLQIVKKSMLEKMFVE